jgi:hypothetical protein
MTSEEVSRVLEGIVMTMMMMMSDDDGYFFDDFDEESWLEQQP